MPTLNEFVAVAVRKLGMPWKQILDALQAIGLLCVITQRYGYHIYDALVIAATIRASCSTLFSEDMHSGHKIDDLTIRNPFLPARA